MFLLYWLKNRSNTRYIRPFWGETLKKNRKCWYHAFQSNANTQIKPTNEIRMPNSGNTNICSLSTTIKKTHIYWTKYSMKSNKIRFMAVLFSISFSVSSQFFFRIKSNNYDIFPHNANKMRQIRKSRHFSFTTNDALKQREHKQKKPNAKYN